MLSRFLVRFWCVARLGAHGRVDLADRQWMLRSLRTVMELVVAVVEMVLVGCDLVEGGFLEGARSTRAEGQSAHGAKKAEASPDRGLECPHIRYSAADILQGGRWNGLP
jgi:hypothetical protein